MSYTWTKYAWVGVAIVAVTTSLGACEQAIMSQSVDPKPDIMASVFTQDGSHFSLKVGEELSVLMELPAMVKSTTAIWLPVEGSLDPVLKITRSYRSLEDDILYTEHQFIGDVTGLTVVTFAVKDKGEIIDPERRTLTFTVTN